MTHHLKPLGWATLGVLVLGVGFALVQLKPDTPSTHSKVASSVSSQSSSATAPTATQISTKLKKRWSTILADVDTPVSIPVYSKQYNTTITLNNQPSAVHTTASIAKVGFLTQLLHQAQASDTTLTTTQADEATRAIENSDNDAATALYDDIGASSGVTTLFTNLKMTGSAAGTNGWAATTTTATDQLTLLNQIFYSGDYLSTKSQAYIKNLMANVESDQQWGVSAGAKAFQLKNGWRLNSDNTWIVNSIGHLGTGDQSCTIAVLTDDNQSLESGEKLVEKLAKASGDVLGLAQ